MAAWLSEEWAREVQGTGRSLPPVEGVTGTVALAIGVARKKEVRLSWRYQDGVPAPATDGGATLDLTIGADDAADLFTGRVEPSVSFMRGRLKASGDGSLLLGFLASTATKGFQAWAAGALETADADTRPALTS